MRYQDVGSKSSRFYCVGYIKLFCRKYRHWNLKQRLLHVSLRKFMQVSKAFLRGTQYTIRCAGVLNQCHKLFCIRTGNIVGISIGADIFLPDAGEITIQRLIEIFPVAFPQRDTNIEHQNSLNSCLQAIIKQAFYILPGIVNKKEESVSSTQESVFPILYISSTLQNALS